MLLVPTLVALQTAHSHNGAYRKSSQPFGYALFSLLLLNVLSRHVCAQVTWMLAHRSGLGGRACRVWQGLIPFVLTSLCPLSTKLIICIVLLFQKKVAIFIELFLHTLLRNKNTFVFCYQSWAHTATHSVFYHHFISIRT
ncbi:hypothetical protein TFUB4_01643 [Tannerella forsythia]|nr:hypothetical protein TFUB4_01643 [Tannerella forsythia]